MKPWNNKTNCFVSDHPLIADKLTVLRDKNTVSEIFRSGLETISQFLFFEASRHMKCRVTPIETPLEAIDGQQLEQPILLVPILRAGLAMSNAIRQVCPASVGMIGMYRDHETLQPVEYYLNLPDSAPEMEVFLLDPMLATGGSAVAAIEAIHKQGVKKITMIALIGAPEGADKIHESFADIPIYLAAMDRQLNDIGYILPGLGDAGDRYFGTE
ncbi:MAG: uracil phosphoribosyltransferase [Calditrichia bacterium]